MTVVTVQNRRLDLIARLTFSLPLVPNFFEQFRSSHDQPNRLAMKLFDSDFPSRREDFYAVIFRVVDPIHR